MNVSQQSLEQRVIVITGASSGFGKGAALKFAQNGAAVVLAARRDRLLEDLARECEANGGRALPVPTDVSHPMEVAQLAQVAVDNFGRIDVWVNNAGVGVIGRFEEIPLGDHLKVIETDLLGTLYGSYFAMQQFRRQRSGILINIASVLGKIPAPYYASYVAAKHGVAGLSGALRQELEQHKIEDIHVCTVLPTSFDTPFFDHAANYTGYESKPIPPLYDPEKVVEAIVRLAMDPKDEVTVGAAAKAMTLAHQLAPGITERLMRRQTQQAQIEQAAPSEVTQGSLHDPSAKGQDISGGRLK